MRVFIVLPLVLALGCSSGNNMMMMMMAPDASSNGTDGGASTCPKFTRESIDGYGSNAPSAGASVSLSLDTNGNPVAAYGVTPKGTSNYEIWYAARASNGTWTKEKVIDPTVHITQAACMTTAMGMFSTQISLAWVDGAPHIVYHGGSCDYAQSGGFTGYPTDLMLNVKMNGTWNESTLVELSNEANCMCDPGLMGYCTFGVDVGLYASIAAKPGGGGYAVVYRNQHNSNSQDDYARANAEAYVSGGPGPMKECVDSARSGGKWGDITYSKAKNPVMAYDLDIIDQAGPMATGIWTAAGDGSGINWKLTHVLKSQTDQKMAMATAQDGTIYLALFESDDNQLFVMTSTTDGNTWKPTIADQHGKTGLHPSIAIDKQNRPVVAYTYCDAASVLECPGSLTSSSKVRIARLEGSTWHLCDVDNGQGEGFVGAFTSIVVTPDGKLGVAFVDDQNHELLYAREM
jgi:hypothetical protein